MKIHYISDTHLDFHVSEKMSHKASKQLKEVLNYMFDINEDSCYNKDIAILGGDLSHSEWQIEFMFNHLTEYFAKVIVVLGNHDYYLISNAKVNKYNNSSHNRVKKIKSIAEQYGAIVLDRTIYECNDFAIAGATMWYPLVSESEKMFYKTFSNDSRLIKGVDVAKESMLDQEFFEQLYHEYGDKLNVFVSHVPIVNTPKNQEMGSDCYYCPVEWIPNIVLQGHTHEILEFDKYGSKVVMNGMGYDNIIKAKVFEA